MYQRVEVLGYLGHDPETRFSQGGVAITTFSVATTDKWRDKQTGEQQERTEWHRITTFNRLAEIAGEYLRKGKLVFIAGQLQTDKWEKDGITRYTTKIIARELKMMPDGNRSEPRRPEPQQNQATTMPDDDFDDDIPF